MKKLKQKYISSNRPEHEIIRDLGTNYARRVLYERIIARLRDEHNALIRELNTL